MRDVGALHTAALRPGLGARRYLLGGPAVEIADVAAMLGELTGRTGCRNGPPRTGCCSGPAAWPTMRSA